MFGLWVMTKNGKALPGLAGEGGPPLMRGVFLPARDWQIEDTWYVAGIKCTGSHHITLRDTLVPAANFFDLAGTQFPHRPSFSGVRHLWASSLALPTRLWHTKETGGRGTNRRKELIASENPKCYRRQRTI
jgi:hypothetical protein